MATTQDKVKIVKTTNISNKDASIYGEDAVIFDISGGIYLGNNTKNGNKIAVSPNDLSTGLATKLNTSGGSISGALTLTGTTADKAAIDFSRVGYNYISIPEGDSRLAFSVGAHSIANTKMAILTSGRVGIGTTDPTEKLEVSGNAKATKFIGALQGNADSASMSYGLKTFLPANADANHNTFYIGGQYAVSTTEEEGKVFVGSSGNRKVISVPILDGSSTTANVMNLRMSFNANYWHDIATGPNRQDLCHRAVNNNTARDWSTILDTANYNLYVVPKAGGTFTGQVKLQSAGGGAQLLINNTQNTETYFYLQAAGVNKAAFVTNNATYGTAIYDATSKMYLGIKSDGTPHYQGYELLSTHNYSTFTVPKAGGAFTGNVSAPDFITTSDARLKDFVDDIAIDFDALKSIPKKTYYWKDKDKYGDQLEIGTSAQELMKVYPECVSYDDESDKYSVNYQKLSIVALAAIDKLHDENAELKSRLDKIEKLLNI